jgi:hypothetical protein
MTSPGIHSLAALSIVTLWSTTARFIRIVCNCEERDSASLVKRVQLSPFWGI